MKFVLDDEIDNEVTKDEVPHVTRRRPTLNCLCGRFARWVGDRHYYNGTFDCYSYTVDCSRCGEVTIECV